ncbi:MarR family transcriptional regulator [Herbaspirillum sp. RTI4]|uniref:MarR family transcriptional regulator n=1 Tax=Herbaspirillum sp. RTI4 TaxID=3048640 RepID=UPI002AB55D7A|nr:MarR family transcriptional regulator [Herbaspirillum sp. RTI4]MDY7577947.1 MarR family transcriptional regulator [Herbaspirillum sp. RTI4]MEA9981607.1 MarR family transcriptional regulator [Herbaspirillum sp. RTI4]
MFEHCLYFNTNALARRLDREWVRAFKPFDLTPPQAFMLRAILNKPGLLQWELAKEMGISRPTATRSIDGLVMKQLIERKDSDRDGRESCVVPLQAALDLHQCLDAASGEVTRRLKNLLGVDVFVETVGKIRDVRTVMD